jgi:hypothetical protein
MGSRLKVFHYISSGDLEFHITLLRTLGWDDYRHKLWGKLGYYNHFLSVSSAGRHIS